MLKGALATLLAMSVIANTGSQIGYAVETTTSSSSEKNESSSTDTTSNIGVSNEWIPRFPVGRGGDLSGLSSSGNNGNDIDDADWVEHKDDDRHGITSSGSSAKSKDGIGVGHKGKATGTYAVEINGKSYYWYHQSYSCPGCTYCSTWTTMGWGGGGTFGSDGCAIYSLAIIVSNLTGQEITPNKLLTDMGCSINKSNTYCDTSSSKYINGHSLAMGQEGIGQFICEQYGLEMEPNLNELSLKDCQTKVDEILDKGGMVWYRYSGGSWATYRTSSHFIPIRDHDEKGYYILDESSQPDGANSKPIPFETLYNEQHSSPYFVGFWPSGAPAKSSSTSNTSSSSVSSTGNGSAYSMWAGSANQLKQYANKVDLGSGFYLYDGLPWAADSSTFAIDVDTATIAVEQYVKKTSGDNTATCKKKNMQGDDGNYSSIEVLKTESRITNQGGLGMDGGAWTAVDGGKYADCDGVRCLGVGVPPGYTDWDYNVDFGPNDGGNKTDNLNRWALDYGCRTDIYNAKAAIVLYELDTKKLWYLPAKCCSAKGHAFPGGLIQTNASLAHSSSWVANPCKLDSSGYPESFNVGVAREGYDWDTTISGAISEIMNLMNHKNPSGYSCWDYTYSVFECWNVPNCVDSKIIDSGKYAAVGWVLWPAED